MTTIYIHHFPQKNHIHTLFLAEGAIVAWLGWGVGRGWEGEGGKNLHRDERNPEQAIQNTRISAKRRPHDNSLRPKNEKKP